MQANLGKLKFKLEIKLPTEAKVEVKIKVFSKRLRGTPVQNIPRSVKETPKN